MLSADDIFENFHTGPGLGSYREDGWGVAWNLRQRFTERTADLQRLAAGLDEAWTGEAADAAGRGLNPIALNLAAAADTHDRVQDSAYTQMLDFDRTRAAVRPVPPQPVMEDPVSFDDLTSYRAKSLERITAGETNVAAYQDYFQRSATNTGAVPIEAHFLPDPQHAEVVLGNRSHTGGPGPVAPPSPNSAPIPVVERPAVVERQTVDSGGHGAIDAGHETWARHGGASPEPPAASVGGARRDDELGSGETSSAAAAEQYPTSRPAGSSASGPLAAGGGGAGGGGSGIRDVLAGGGGAAGGAVGAMPGRPSSSAVGGPNARTGGAPGAAGTGGAGRGAGAPMGAPGARGAGSGEKDTERRRKYGRTAEEQGTFATDDQRSAPPVLGERLR